MSQRRPDYDALRALEKAREGIWTMTETEFKFSLARAWDEGQRAWADELLNKAPGTNPYERKP